MADTSARSAVWLLGGAVVGWVAGRFSGTNYAGLGNLIGQVVPEAAAVSPWAYGRGHGGHSAAPFILYDTERRIAGLEAASAANAVAIQKDAQIDAIRDRLMAEVTDGKIYKATCHKVDGRVYLSPTHLADSYRSSARVLDSHPAGCGDCGNWY